MLKISTSLATVKKVSAHITILPATYNALFIPLKMHDPPIGISMDFTLISRVLSTLSVIRTYFASCTTSAFPLMLLTRSEIYTPTIIPALSSIGLHTSSLLLLRSAGARYRAILSPPSSSSFLWNPSSVGYLLEVMATHQLASPLALLTHTHALLHKLPPPLLMTFSSSPPVTYVSKPNLKKSYGIASGEASPLILVNVPSPVPSIIPLPRAPLSPLTTTSLYFATNSLTNLSPWMAFIVFHSCPLHRLINILVYT